MCTKCAVLFWRKFKRKFNIIKIFSLADWKPKHHPRFVRLDDSGRKCAVREQWRISEGRGADGCVPL